MDYDKTATQIQDQKARERNMASDSPNSSGDYGPAAGSFPTAENNSSPTRRHHSRELLDAAIRDLDKNIRERRSNMECEAKLAHGLRELRDALPTRMSSAAEDALLSMLVAARG